MEMNSNCTRSHRKLAFYEFILCAVFLQPPFRPPPLFKSRCGWINTLAAETNMVQWNKLYYIFVCVRCARTAHILLSVWPNFFFRSRCWLHLRIKRLLCLLKKHWTTFLCSGGSVTGMTEQTNYHLQWVANVRNWTRTVLSHRTDRSIFANLNFVAFGWLRAVRKNVETVTGNANWEEKEVPQWKYHWKKKIQIKINKQITLFVIEKKQETLAYLGTV